MSDRPAAPPTAVTDKAANNPKRHAHELRFASYPKLLFAWPLILAGYILSFVAQGADPAALETLAWIYVWVTVLVILALGVDLDRNQAAFLLVFLGGVYALGLWLRDVKGFTLFGDIYRWFANLDLQYNAELGTAVSILLTVPYVLMLLWARFNDRWRITHNEFEHYSFGRMDDSLGRGAKTIRTSFPDMFEVLLGLAGTLVVYNASGTQELRRIPHVPLLPFRRRKLNKILERVAVTDVYAAQSEAEEETM